VISATLDNVTQGELQRYKNNYNAPKQMRGGDHLGAASSAVTPPTSLPTTPRVRSLTPPTSTTTTTTIKMTPATRVMTRRSTALGQEKEEVSEDHVPSVCYSERLRLLQ
jgi:hypothetical protein